MTRARPRARGVRAGAAAGRGADAGRRRRRPVPRERGRSRASATAPRCGSATGSGPTASTSPSATGSRTCCWRAGPTGGAAACTSGVLLDNTPEYLFALGGAALAGAAVVGRQPHTTRGASAARSAAHRLRPADQRAAPPAAARARRRRSCPSCSCRTATPTSPIRPPRSATTSTRRSPRWTRPMPGIEPGPDTLWGLIFTSGTSDAPKAVICTQRRLLVTGTRMGIIMDLGADDIGYVCMPLFHSSALMVGWAPSLVYGASVGLGRRFSASGLARRRPALRRDVHQLHRQAPRVHRVDAGAARRRGEHRCAWPSATRGRPRSCDRFARRFGLEVIDAYGATEGGIAVNRDAEGSRRRARAGRRERQGRRRGGQRAPGRPVRRRRPARQRGRVRRRDRQHCGCRPVRGLLQQRRGQREDAAVRLVLERRPRVPRRRPLPVLRRSQRRLDSRRRRELPGPADRDGVRPSSGRGARGRLRRSGRPGGGPGDGRARAPRRRDVRSGRVRRAGSTRRTRSARSGGRATYGSCAIRRRPARTRS